MGKTPKLNFFEGCSAGGRQAFQEAQRYPADYDGIVAGSPGVNWTGRSAQAVWIGQQTHKDETTPLPQAKFQVIKDAVLAACDTLDGVKDGVLENPRKCQFDPKVLACAAGRRAKLLDAGAARYGAADLFGGDQSADQAGDFPGPRTFERSRLEHDGGRASRFGWARTCSSMSCLRTRTGTTRRSTSIAIWS